MANNYCSVPKDWAELSPDLLPLIAHKLGEIVYFIRFRAVCKQWRLATNLSDNPPQFPWIMMLKLDMAPKINFHTLPSGKIFSSHFLKYINTLCIHRRPDDMIVEKDQSSLLVNKFSTYRFPLTDKWFRCNMISGHDQVIALPTAPVGNISKFFYTALSSKIKNLIVIFPLGKMFAHYRGRIFKLVTTRHGTVVDVSDVHTEKVLSTISCPVEVMVGSCLISTRDGLLMVSRQFVYYGKPYYDYRFVVYRLENYDNNHPNWTILSGIGDMMLFLDEHNAFSLIASEYDHGYRGNCIYFITHLKDPSPFNSKTHHYRVVRYDMEERRSFEVCYLGHYNTRRTELYWFIPSLV